MGGGGVGGRVNGGEEGVVEGGGEGERGGIKYARPGNIHRNRRIYIP